MSDDLDTMEDTMECPLAEETDDSCTLEFIEIVPLDTLDTMEDTQKCPLAEETDDSCTLEFIEIVPLDRPPDDWHTSEFIYLVEVKPEDLQEMKQEPAADEDYNDDSIYSVKLEPADEYEREDPCFSLHVSSVCTMHLCCSYYTSRQHSLLFSALY